MMKIFYISIAFVFAVFLFGSNFAVTTEAISDHIVKSAPIAAPTPIKTKHTENSPENADAETAYSPVYAINSKSCKNRDDQASEGDEFVRECKGYGGYALTINGSDYRKNYGITKDPFSVMLFPLDDGDASDYVRADKYLQKLGDKVEWRLDEKGKPYAVIVRAYFYKNKGSKTFSNPKNKVAEFLLVRGLAGYEGLKADIQTKDTAYNPNEWARKVAAEFLEKK